MHKEREQRMKNRGDMGGGGLQKRWMMARLLQIVFCMLIEQGMKNKREYACFEPILMSYYLIGLS